MKRIHLLGSEGFIGRALQQEARGIPMHCWSHRQPAVDHHFNLLDPSSWQSLLSQRPSQVILLSWPGLPSYQETFHITRNLPACIDLLERLISAGLERLVVAGTCYEYGLQNGRLSESLATDPVNCYAIAKDSLRRVVSGLCHSGGLQWCWARIFYVYGNGQNPDSFLPSLQSAIDREDSTFSMSSGRQVRDFIHVSHVAKLLLRLATHPKANGIYNCGSGQPQTLREIAEKRIKESSSKTILKLGAYPDRTDEPLAFWADTNRLSHLT